MGFELSALPDGWEVRTLEDCVEHRSVTYGIVQPGTGDADGIPMLRVNNFQQGGLRLEEVLRISREVESKYVRTRLQGGEVLLTLVGSVGQVAIAPPSIRGWNVARAVGVMRPRDEIGAKWLSICLRSPDSQRILGLGANTTVQTTINLKDVKALPVPIPPKPERDGIEQIISALDDKIALLRETNATLEAIAQAIFKSWFVDFDPVRAKAEGRDPEGMPPEVADLFPSEFEDSELGAIPKGWRNGSLGEVVSILDYKRVPLSGAARAKRQGTYPYYGAAALMDFVDDYLFDGIYLLMGEDGSVTNQDGTPILQYVWGKIWVNNHAHVLQGTNGISTEHLMLALKKSNIAAFVTGAVQAKLNQGNLSRIPFMIPSASISEAFTREIHPLYDSFRANVETMNTLTDLRDSLLPRLMSGKLRLRDVEKVYA